MADETNKLADKPKPNPEDYGFIAAKTKEEQDEWTVEGGEARYYEDLEAWDIAQADAEFERTMKEMNEERNADGNKDNHRG